MMDDIALTGGFAQPVFEAQATFRLVMDAMAHPGSITSIPADVAAPGSLGIAQAALLLTLADADTPVLIPAAPPELAAWLAFHTGTRLTTAAEEAVFAFVGRGGTLPGGLPLGTQDYPDRSATLVIEVEAFGRGETLNLTGPGIKDRTELSVAGLPDGLLTLLADNRTLFPRGIDVLLTAGRDLVALPRSTRTEA